MKMKALKGFTPKVAGSALATLREVFPHTYSMEYLFRNGEQGLWYDISDLSSLYQDSAGTTPVTGVEQPVGLVLDKSGNGYDASQVTSTARGKFSSRYNMLDNTELYASSFPYGAAAYTVGGIAPDGTDTLNVYNFTSGTQTSYGIFSVAAGVQYSFQQYVGLGTASASGYAIYDHTNSAWIVTQAQYTGLSSEVARKEVVFTTPGNCTSIRIYPVRYIDATNLGTVKVWGASLVPANQAHLPYQRVGNSPFDLASRTDDYDSDPSKFPAYIQADLVDDKLTTTVPAITGQIALATTKGLWIDDITLSAGAFEIGPTTYTGGPDGLLSMLNAQVIGYVLREGTFSASEVSAMTQYYKRKGCPGLITLGSELVTTDTVTYVAAAMNTTTTIGTTADADGKFFIAKYNATVSAGSMRLMIYGVNNYYLGVTENATVDRAMIVAITSTGGSAKNIIRTQSRSEGTAASFSEISVREVIFP